jgi:hypothetical protein
MCGGLSVDSWAEPRKFLDRPQTGGRKEIDERRRRGRLGGDAGILIVLVVVVISVWCWKVIQTIRGNLDERLEKHAAFRGQKRNPVKSRKHFTKTYFVTQMFSFDLRSTLAFLIVVLVDAKALVADS